MNEQRNKFRSCTNFSRHFVASCATFRNVKNLVIRLIKSWVSTLIRNSKRCSTKLNSFSSSHFLISRFFPSSSFAVENNWSRNYFLHDWFFMMLNYFYSFVRLCFAPHFILFLTSYFLFKLIDLGFYCPTNLFFIVLLFIPFLEYLICFAIDVSPSGIRN